MSGLASNDFYVLGLILLFPLLGAIINGILGHKLPKQVVWVVACTTVGLSFALSLMTFASMSQRVGRDMQWKAGVEVEEVELARSGLLTELRAASRLDFTTMGSAEDVASGLEGLDGAVSELAKLTHHESEAGAVVSDITAKATAYWQASQADDEAARSAARKGFSDSLNGASRTGQQWLLSVREMKLKTASYEYELYSWITSGDYADELDVRPMLQETYMPMDATPDGEGRVLQTGIMGVRTQVRGEARVFSGVDIKMSLSVDALSIILLLIITGVGFLIHLYSVGYMRHDKSKARYFAYLNLFIFSMLLLVLGDNMVVMFVGWEGVGVCSYLLIGYYYESHANADAGKKAFIVNRVGDFAFILGMMTLFFWFGTLDFGELEALILADAGGEHQGTVLTVACLLLFVGCTGKSAQLPLYVWLPDAMAGPTPVSALIHAATMVTAGVYLIGRMHFAFIEAPAAMLVVACVGALTAFFAATIAVTQTDIKKVLAYSTVSQLGYMFLAVGVGAWWAAVFHLMTHAFFKALLFLGSGSVIDAMHHEQDIGKMGGLRKKMPVTAVTFLIGCIAISGVPLVASGFYSKDAILWYAWFNEVSASAAWLHNVLWAVGLATAGLTAFYMFRLYFRTFEGECRAPEEMRDHITESPLTMTIPLVVLAILSVVAGFIGVPHVMDFLAEPNRVSPLTALPMWLGSVMDSAVPHAAMDHDTEVFYEWLLMLISVAVATAGIALAYVMYVRKPEMPKQLAERMQGLYQLSLEKYRVDEAYHMVIVRPLLAIGAVAHWLTDRILIDGFIVNGSAKVYRAAGSVLRHLQNGELQRYAAFIVLGIAAMMYLVLL